jgi:hypothetical protein
MNPLAKMLDALKRRKEPADLDAEHEAKRIQDRNLDVRLSGRGGTGAENYQSGRGSK